MYIDDCDFTVIFSEFSDRNYCKTFSKKYKGHWDVTKTSIIESLKRAHGLQSTSLLECIKYNGCHGIFKFEFKIAKSDASPHASGNRAILYLNNELHEIEVLLVYSKNEICHPNETQKWEDIIIRNFPEYWNVCIE